MKTLLSKENLTALEQRLSATSRLLLFVDYDSVLVDSAAEGRPLPLQPQEREPLRELSEKNGLTLVLISNYSLNVLKKMAGFSGIYLIGNNGLEIFGPDLNVVHAETKRVRNDIGPIYEKINAKLAELDGVVLDNRDVSLALNFAHTKAAVQRKARLLMEQIWTPVMDIFALQETNNELVLRPRVGWGKNRAMMFIWNKFSSPRRRPFVIYISGQDNEDDIYTLLGREGMGVVMGGAVRANRSKAGYHLKNRAEVHKFISWLSQNVPRIRFQNLSS